MRRSLALKSLNWAFNLATAQEILPAQERKKKALQCWACPCCSTRPHSQSPAYQDTVNLWETAIAPWYWVDRTHLEITNKVQSHNLQLNLDPSGKKSLWNVHISLHPAEGTRRQDWKHVLTSWNFILGSPQCVVQSPIAYSEHPSCHIVDLWENTQPENTGIAIQLCAEVSPSTVMWHNKHQLKPAPVSYTHLTLPTIYSV